MPYFSFSLKNKLKQDHFNFLNDNVANLKLSIQYYSKNTLLHKTLSKIEFKPFLNSLSYEKRLPIAKLKKTILICLPPSIGLGDAIEYGLAIKSLHLSNIFEKIGIAYVGRYKELYENYFKLENIFADYISSKDLVLYENIFHITLEIEEFKNQKYERTDIEKIICKYFGISVLRQKNIINKNKINKISIFPISKSPLRTMNISLLKGLIKNFENRYKIDLILDKSSIISSHVDDMIDSVLIKKIYPLNLDELLNIIKNVEYGIFMDSGPLHVAKILNIKGVLISTSVDAEILLNDFTSIGEIRNYYKSDYCKSPCGLTNIFNFNNKSGCFDSLKLPKKEIIYQKNLNSLQRGSLKQSYTYFIDNPVGCNKNISLKHVTNYIISKINENTKRFS